ncbi:MAG: heme NO-binding domain-containing protein, partial [Planctomycetia bacterium]
MHGLIFFSIQKFAESAAHGDRGGFTVRSSVATSAARYLPSGVYPDAEAVELLQSIADSSGHPLREVLERFGRFLAP